MADENCNGKVDEQKMDSSAFCLDGGWSYTDRPVVHVFHTWAIDQQALVSRRDTHLTSRRFGYYLDDEVTWTVGLKAKDDYFLQDVTPLNSPQMPVKVDVYIEFSSKKFVPVSPNLFFKAELRAQEAAVVDDTVAKESLVVDCRATSAGSGMQVLQRDTPVTIRTVHIVDTDTTLTLRVDIAYVADHATARAVPLGVSMLPCSLSDDLETLMHQEETTDAILVDDNGNQYKVHRAILAVRSPVFAAMFKHDMLESATGKVQLKDVSGEAMRHILRYIYTGRVDPTYVDTGLLALADRFQLLRLKKLCEKELAGTVAMDNALHLLVQADHFTATALRDEAVQFVSTNVRDLMTSAAWKELESRPHLLSKVLAKCVQGAT